MTSQQHLTVDLSHLFRHFLLLASGMFSFYPKGCSFPPAFGGSTSYSQSLNIRVWTASHLCLHPVFWTLSYLIHFEHHLNADNAHVCIPALISSLNSYSSASLTSLFRWLAGISAFSAKHWTPYLPPSKLLLLSSSSFYLIATPFFPCSCFKKIIITFDFLLPVIPYFQSVSKFWWLSFQNISRIQQLLTLSLASRLFQATSILT